MSKQSEEEMRNSIIGLGEKSIRKSYFPQLKQKLLEIEELNRNLEKKVEERTAQLSEQKNLFETLFYDTSNALALLKNGRFIDCNDALLKILGYTNKDFFLNLQLHELSPEFQLDGQRSKNKADALLKQCLQKGSIQFEWLHKNIKNELVWVEVTLTKIVLNLEVHIHVFWKDITDKKQLEAEVKHHQEELEESNYELQAMIHNLKSTQKRLIESEKLASLGQIVSGISKEINTPIDISVTAITFLLHNFTDIKERFEELSEEEMKHFFTSSEELSSTINNNLQKIAKLIRYFQKIEIQQTDYTKREFNIKEYLQGILLSLDEKLKKYQVTVNIKCKNELKIYAHPEDYTQIITTLISNSLKHGFDKKDKGEITIEIQQNENNMLKLLYQDTGKGIKKEILPKIFDPFFTQSTKQSVHGLGLSIIYNIITNKLHGTIQCESIEDQGLTFEISIPIEGASSNANLTYYI